MDNPMPQVADKRLISCAEKFLALKLEDRSLNAFVQFVQEERLFNRPRVGLWRKDALKALRLAEMRQPMSNMVPVSDTFFIDRNGSGEVEGQQSPATAPPRPKRRRPTIATNQNGVESELNADWLIEVPIAATTPLPFAAAVGADLLHALVPVARGEKLAECTFLLLGPRASGKSCLVRTVAHLSNLPLLQVDVNDLILDRASSRLSEPRHVLQGLLERLRAVAPAIWLLSNAEILNSKAATAARCAILRLLRSDVMAGARVLLVFESSEPAALMDDELRATLWRRAELAPLDTAQRATALDVLLNAHHVTLDSDCPGVLDIARERPGHQLGDLARLATELRVRAGIAPQFSLVGLQLAELASAARASWQQPADQPVTVTVDTLRACLSAVQPLAKAHASFISVPDTRWSDVGGQENAKRHIRESFLSMLEAPDLALALHRQVDGLLLVGPPGCGKTLLARAVSAEAGLNFLSVKGPEILNKYLGESERAVRVLFERARAAQPCLIFFDEIDAISAARGTDHGAHTTVVNMLLTELDGLESRGRVFVMAATNRAELLDEAMRRPGRFGTTVQVTPPCDSLERADVLAALTRQGTRPSVLGDEQTSGQRTGWRDVFMRVAEDSRVAGCSGADLKFVLERAKLHAQRSLTQTFLDSSCFDVALNDFEIQRRERLKSACRERAFQQKVDSLATPLL